MRKRFILSFLTCVSFAAVLSSCHNDDYLLAPPPVPDQSFVEEFDTVSSALARGWKVINASVPLGGNVWQQGGSPAPWFQAYSTSGSYVGFIGADYTSTSAAAGIISNWLISPVVTLQNGDKIVFYTRALQYADVDPITGNPNGDSTDYGNRLQVLINTSGEGTEVGKGASVGNFTTTLLDINPNYNFSHSKPNLFDPYAYPAQWTRFEAEVYGLNAPVKGRFALRYFVENGGFNGLGSGVGVDQVTYISKKQ